jgi:regulator of replication initiation timing
LKLFSFNASSFALDPSVESLLKSKGAITLDFGTSAYINSDAMPAILSELASAASLQSSNNNANEALVAQLKVELARFGAERQKLMDESTRLASQLRTYANEVGALKAQVSASAKTIEALKAENIKLQTVPKSAPAAQAAAPSDAAKQALEKLRQEFQALKAQNAEAITSLKVLEDENDELREEVEMLRSQVKNAPPAPKAG